MYLGHPSILVCCVPSRVLSNPLDYILALEMAVKGKEEAFLGTWEKWPLSVCGVPLGTSLLVLVLV